MIAAVLSLTLLGLALGWVLGFAARYLRVENNPLHEEIQLLLPGVNCGQCGYPGCNGAAEALAADNAPVTLCPPGGPPLVQTLAAKLGVAMDGAALSSGPPLLAQVNEATCIGCAHCGKRCNSHAGQPMLHTHDVLLFTKADGSCAGAPAFSAGVCVSRPRECCRLSVMLVSPPTP